MPLNIDLPEHVIRTADRLARRMGGRFVLNKEPTPMTTDLPELRKRLIAGAVWSVLIADHHADTLTPRQIERLYDASNAMRKADAALQKLAELEAENAPKFATGDRVLYVASKVSGIHLQATVVAYVEGWITLRFADASSATVRPSCVHPLPSPPKGPAA